MSLFSSTTIRIVPQTLRDNVDALTDGSETMADTLDTVKNAIDALLADDAWRSITATTIQSLTAKNVQEYQKAADKLADMAQFLENVATEMESTDNSIKSKIESIG